MIITDTYLSGFFSKYRQHPEIWRGYKKSSCLAGDIPDIEDLRRELVEVYAALTVSTNESHEYKKILDQYPGMRPQMREHYFQSRENASKLTAKLNALKIFIQEHPHNDQKVP